MSYYRKLKDTILSLKEVFYLSPREIWFLSFLEEAGYPLEVVKEGIKEFYLSVPPEKRHKTPLFFSFGKIDQLNHQLALKKGREVKIDWKRRYMENLEKIKLYITEEDIPQEPQSEREAEEKLKHVENLLVKRLWENLSEEEKTKIIRKYLPWRKNEEIFKLMIKHEVFKLYNIKPLSLYVI
jgi:hypothetical protein